MIDSSIRYLKGVGPKLEQVINGLDIYTVRDLLCYFPFRYEDRTRLTAIRDVKEGEYVLIKAEVSARNLRRTGKSFSFYKGRTIFEIIVSDDSGKIDCVWFNQPFLEKQIKVRDILFLYGKAVRYKGKMQLSSPEFEIFSGDIFDSAVFGSIIGRYHLKEGITQKRLRRIIYTAVKDWAEALPDPLPCDIRSKRNFFDISDSVKYLHRPGDFSQADMARERFIFEELFFSQIMVYVRKAGRMSQKGISFFADPGFLRAFKKKLGFTFTSAQQKTLASVLNDMRKPVPMHRLIQGDVGSGKTAVALCAAAVCAENGFQASLMAPTEVLAEQHFQTLLSLLAGTGIKVDMLSSSSLKKDRESSLSALAKGETSIIVGTHALLQKDVSFKSLGLVVIDEEHKFGVAQRELLPKKGKNPDFLVMSATPIPRSLALTLYGDLDISVIDELPPGRKQPLTRVVKEKERNQVYAFIRKKISQGRQAYIVYPVIEESGDEDLRSLKEMYAELKQYFSSCAVDIFHGKMKKQEKQKVIDLFRRGRINILVSTTVIEVGVNVENASLMVVENPERFGLAQLHQLRGRIRRSGHQPFFLMIAGPGLSLQSRKRLSVLEKVSDGFVIAEEDLKLRGPGDFFGNSQWGYPQLKKANPIKDIALLKKARQDAKAVIDKDPGLNRPEHRCIRDHLKI